MQTICKNTLLGLGLLGGVLGCGSGGSATSTATVFEFSGAEWVLKSGDPTRSSSEISGTGSFVARTPFAGVNGERSYTLSFTIQDGGSMTLIMNSDAELSGGLNFEVSRSGSTLAVVLRKGSDSNTVTSSFTGSIDVTGTISMIIDQHNQETPAHVLVWTGSTTTFNSSTAIFNSDDVGKESPGNGTGVYWGVSLVSAAIAQAQVGSAKFGH